MKRTDHFREILHNLNQETNMKRKDNFEEILHNLNHEAKWVRASKD